MTEAAVRYALTFPGVRPTSSPGCARAWRGSSTPPAGGSTLLAGTLERRRVEEGRIDTLARFLRGRGRRRRPARPGPGPGAGGRLLAEEACRPLRFLAAEPAGDAGYLGGPEYRCPGRFVAAHGLNCASVLARLVRNDPDWQDQAREVVLAGLLHDVGMLRVDLGLLSLCRARGTCDRAEGDRGPCPDGADRLLAGCRG